MHATISFFTIFNDRGGEKSNNPSPLRSILMVSTRRAPRFGQQGLRDCYPIQGERGGGGDANFFCKLVRSTVGVQVMNGGRWHE